MKAKDRDKGIGRDDESSFDDCLRVLVNTPPQPKKAEKKEQPRGTKPQK